MGFTHVAADLDLQDVQTGAEVRLEHPVEDLRPLWLLVRQEKRGSCTSAAKTANTVENAHRRVRAEIKRHCSLWQIVRICCSYRHDEEESSDQMQPHWGDSATYLQKQPGYV